MPLGVALFSGPTKPPPRFATCLERAAALRAERGLLPEASTTRMMANTAPSRGATTSKSQRRGEMLVARGEQLDDALLVTEGHYLVGASAFWRGAFESSTCPPPTITRRLRRCSRSPAPRAVRGGPRGGVPRAPRPSRCGSSAAPTRPTRSSSAGTRPGRCSATPVHAGLRADPRRVGWLSKQARTRRQLDSPRVFRHVGWNSVMEVVALPLFPGWAAVQGGDAAGRDTAASEEAVKAPPT